VYGGLHAHSWKRCFGRLHVTAIHGAPLHKSLWVTGLVSVLGGTRRTY
jgi:hypothetical protein